MKNPIRFWIAVRSILIRFVVSCCVLRSIGVGSSASKRGDGAQVADVVETRYNARSMADEIWHWGNLGAITGVALWLMKKSFTAGSLVTRLEALEKDLGEKHEENIRRLERIETLLMERK